MKLFRTILFLLVNSFAAACCTNHLYAQIVVNFSPAVHGQSLDGLAYAQIINSYPGELIAKIEIRVKENKTGHVVSIKLPSFIIRGGSNEISRASFSNAKFAFGNNNTGLLLSQTGRFPEGDYEYCYEVDISESKNVQLSPVFENCFVHQLQPRTPLLLINPIDEDVFCNKRPNFIWQPPIPLPADARMRFVLTEPKEKQDIVEAITYNPPLVNQGNILSNTLFYPVNAPELREGHRYAWQITVYTGKAILARSEVWVFTLQCNTNKPDTIKESYRELKETLDGNFYVAYKYLRFSLTNSYASGNLNYSIVNMSDPSSPVKGLPALKMNAGLNKYDVDISENNAFKNGQEYLLRVAIAGNRNLLLRFIYKNE